MECEKIMDSICESRLCTGCAACSQVCPRGAVEMAANDEGFQYPNIDKELCTDCGLCREKCPINKTVDTGDVMGTEPVTEQNNAYSIKHKAYACFSADDDVRSGSSSGGAFTQLAQSIISRYGVVFGAEFDGTFRVRHSYTEKVDGLEGLRRSKYVQSDTENTFIKAKEFLNAGREVLFCGTPCQIAGLKSFLNKEYNNLLTCDLACSGVPSPKVWRMYLDYMSGRYKSKVSSISFRDKTDGWNCYNMKIDFENGSRYIDRAKHETFFIGFGKNIFNRISCFNCRFRMQNTKADITLADFWGIDKQNDSDFMDNRGVSLLITNTEKGERELSLIMDKMFIKPEPLDFAIKYNPRLASSVAEPGGRKSFFNDLRDGYTFDRLIRKYMDNYSIKYRVKVLLRPILEWVREIGSHWNKTFYNRNQTTIKRTL